MTSPNLRPLFAMVLNVGARNDAGQGPRGRRTYAVIDGGRFRGERISGDVLPGGADALLVDSEGRRSLDVRLMLRSDTGQHIYLTYRGLFVARDKVGEMVFDPALGFSIDPFKYYMRFCAMFETGAPEFGWLNGVIAAGIGMRTATGPAYEVFELL